ncbi:MAG: hypothetical protein JXA10_05000, partial [Anaerolineae bacterium]|nr:hypothetical protein [Anaerolineae bacterium]
MPDSKRDTSEALELFLLALRYRNSRLVTRGGNEPFLLSDANQAWLVYKGAVDVFAVEIEDGKPSGARHHLFRAYTNQLLLGLDLTDQAVGLLAVCAPETEILTFSRDRLQQQLAKPEHVPIIVGMLETWLRALASGIAPEIKPKDYRRIEHPQEITLQSGQIAGTAREVLWVKHLAGSSFFMGRANLPAITGETFVPLSGYDWLQAAEDATLRPYTTATIFTWDAPWSPLDAHHTRLLHLIQHDIQRAKQTASTLIHDQTRTDNLRLQTAVLRLAAAWSDEPPARILGVDIQDELVAACHIIGQTLGVTITTPPDFDSLPAHKDALDEIARASHLRIRTVLLRDDWEKHDNGPLLAYRGEDDRPVALLPVNGRRYDLHDPVTGDVLPVDATLA